MPSDQKLRCLNRRYPSLYEEERRGSGAIVFVDWRPRAPAFEFAKMEGRTGYIYAIGDGGAAKIGFSENVPQRLVQLQSQSPTPLRLLTSRAVPLAGMAYAEAYCHHSLAARHIRGEWFLAAVNIIRPVMARAIVRARVYEAYCRRWAAEDAERQKEYAKSPGGQAEYAAHQVRVAKARAAYELSLIEQGTVL